jgi:hypothetical protein
MKVRITIALAAVSVLLFADSGRAYYTFGRRWPTGSTIVMHLGLGSPTTTLLDGSRDWDSVAESALATWNPYLNGVLFSSVRDGAAIGGLGATRRLEALPPVQGGAVAQLGVALGIAVA